MLYLAFVLDLLELFCENSGYSIKVSAHTYVDSEAHNSMQANSSGQDKFGMATCNKDSQKGQLCRLLFTLLPLAESMQPCRHDVALEV